MGQFIIKFVLSAIIIVTISELSKRNAVFGGLVASLPLVSFLAILWLYHDTRDVTQVAALSRSIFWLVLPSLVFFIALPLLLNARWGFYSSFVSSTALMLISYGIMMLVLKRLGIQI